MKVLGVLNAKAGPAGSGEALTPAVVREAFASAGVDAIIEARPPADVGPALRAALAARPDAVIVGGGDGTVRSAAELFADSGVPLGVLPLGTLNHFAKDLGLPTDWRDAVRALAGASVREVDVGEVNGRVFINNCSIGSYAEAVRRRDRLRREHGWRKWPAMLSATFQTFRRLRVLRLRVGVATGTRSLRTPLVVIANNHYSGHILERSMRPRLDEGRLWLYAAHVHRHAAVIRLILQALVRRLDEADDLIADPITDAVIECESPALPIATDGELVDLQCPLRFRVRPRALCVLAP